MHQEEVKLKAGQYRIPVTLIYVDERIVVKFRYNKRLIDEVKNMEGSKYHGYDDPTKKFWSIANSHHNIFQLSYLQGLNPYARFDAEIIEHDYERLLYDHQKEFSDFILTMKVGIIAGEMGCGKTLSAIEAMERSGFKDWWWIGPKSALKAVEREFRIWKSIVYPKMMTYEKLTKAMKEWPEGQKAPRGVIFDESARVKNPNAQRSQAAKILANGIREDWGDEGYIILMSGAPAPKSPADWFHQAAIACPGFLREGSQMKFKKRLAIITEKESITGGVYPHLESWLDDTKKCATCGQYQDAEIHQIDIKSVMTGDNDENRHQFKPSKNEVEYLYERMKGLVLVKFKKDCLDLPEKIYRLIELKPSQKILNLARTILSKASTTISGITLLRELSDGFQYRKIEDGVENCPICDNGRIKDPLNADEIIDCDSCGGTGTRKKFKRVADQIECPKEEALRDLLDEMNDVGRVVIYGGFTGSVDRCVQICQACGWNTIRVDGRGWQCDLEGDPLDIFQDQFDKFPRVAFIGQPGAAGMGLTLTSSPVIIYYSNDFNFESRVQSEERAHRPGMDLDRGCTIIDLIHLPTDILVLENLQKKKRLQAMTMGEMVEILK